jgi:hypothetical protein
MTAIRVGREAAFLTTPPQSANSTHLFMVKLLREGDGFLLSLRELPPDTLYDEP